jgi:hypothetical protein
MGSLLGALCAAAGLGTGGVGRACWEFGAAAAAACAAPCAAPCARRDGPAAPRAPEGALAPDWRSRARIFAASCSRQSPEDAESALLYRCRPPHSQAIVGLHAHARAVPALLPHQRARPSNVSCTQRCGAGRGSWLRGLGLLKALAGTARRAQRHCCKAAAPGMNFFKGVKDFLFGPVSHGRGSALHQQQQRRRAQRRCRPQKGTLSTSEGHSTSSSSSGSKSCPPATCAPAEGARPRGRGGRGAQRPRPAAAPRRRRRPAWRPRLQGHGSGAAGARAGRRRARQAGRRAGAGGRARRPAAAPGELQRRCALAGGGR